MIQSLTPDRMHARALRQKEVKACGVPINDGKKLTLAIHWLYALLYWCAPKFN